VKTAQVLVRDIPETVLRRLKRRAAARGRSLQAELKQILIDAAGPDLGHVRRLAESVRNQLRGRNHSDSAALLGQDRGR